MIALCYAAVFVIEALISMYYFEIKFERKVTNKVLFLFMTANFALSYLASLLQILALNFIVFLVINFFFVFFCYSANLKSCLFHVFLLSSLMIATELIISYILFRSFSINETFVNDPFFITTLAVLSKTLYFVTVYLFSRFSVKEWQQENFSVSIFLCILPISSVMFMMSTFAIFINYNIGDNYKILLAICNVLTLLSNIIVFYVHELTIKTNRKYTQLLLEQQKEKTSRQYLDLLKQQNESHKILIHDITKHLNSIKQLSVNHDSSINSYISNIIDDFNVMNPVDYCNNYLLNLITHNYYEICKEKGIEFTVSIRTAKINFMKDHDITALFNNLLENAVESALQTEKKFIDFSICIRNENFLVITVSNSCSKKPKYSNGTLVTSKSLAAIHGFGTKSIKRVISKYQGDIDMTFDEETHTFTSKIILHIQEP